MQKKLRITVEGKVYDVTVEELTEGGHAAPAYPSIAGTGASTSVSTSGPLTAPLPHPAPAATAAAGAGDEVCPLGGVVDSVEVAVGQTVAEGDKVAVIEAMKMKTPVYAHRGGTVTSVAVKPGDAVEAGHVLLTIG
jgi:biotin carboxyl carrier protein